MSSKDDRLREFICPADGRSIVVESSAGLWLGPPPGLEQLIPAVSPILPLVDGLVLSPGQARRLVGRTRQDAALVVRADWTNALRPPNFVLPLERIEHVPLLTPSDALDLGASAVVLYFLLGHEEEIEAGCLRHSVQTAIAANQIGLPLIVDVQATGPRVVLYGKAVELGVSYALESGADGVAVPWPGGKSFETILKMADATPVWIKPSSLDSASLEYAEALESGVTGVWLDERIFAQSDPLGVVTRFCTLVHPPTTTSQV